MKLGSTLYLRLSLIAMAAFIAFICALMSPAFMNKEYESYRLLVVALYVAALPFFYSLYQAWKLLGFIDKKQAFSQASLKALGTVRNCALTISGLFVLYLPIFWDQADRMDAPGIFAIGLLITFMASVIAGFTALLQKLFEQAFTLKSENDLTV